jgi:hypothetical protein
MGAVEGATEGMGAATEGMGAATEGTFTDLHSPFLFRRVPLGQGGKRTFFCAGTGIGATEGIGTTEGIGAATEGATTEGIGTAGGSLTLGSFIFILSLILSHSPVLLL